MSAAGEPAIESALTAPSTNSKHKYGHIDVYTIVSTAWYIFAFIVLGVPIWWKTTEVYRAAIPFQEIESFHLSNVSHLIHVAVLVDDETINPEELFDQIVSANAIRESNIQVPELKFSYTWTVQRAESAVQDLVVNSKSLASLDENLKDVSVVIADVIVVVSKKFLAHPQVIIGAYKAIYIPSVEKDVQSLARFVVTSVVYNVVREDVLREIFQPFSSDKRLKPTKSHQRALHSSPFVDVVITTVVSEPDKMEVTCDSQLGFDAYVKPFVNKIRDAVQLNVKTQYKFGYKVELITEKNEEKGEHFIRYDKLSLLINQFEKVIPGQVSLNPTLNFLVYIVPQEVSPLYIYDEEGKKLESNAFISPRWGGVLFYNLNFSQNGSVMNVEIDNQLIYQVILSQMRPLLGVPERNVDREFDSHFRRDASALADWEVDFLMRRRTHNYLSSAAKRLHSLSKLLNKIGNMVISDTISELTATSVASGKNALRLLAQGHLDSALASAENSFSASEKAFFEPSLLGLLYFPDDQKYAIYVPLFIPTMVPVVFSLGTIFSYFKSIALDRKLKTE